MTCIGVQGGNISSDNLLTTFNSDFGTIAVATGILQKPGTTTTLSILRDYTGSPSNILTALKTANLILSDASFRRLVSITSQPPAATPSDPNEQANLENRNKNFFTHLQNEYRFYNCRYIRVYKLFVQVYNAANATAVDTLMSGANIPQSFKGLGADTVRQSNTLQNIASNGLTPLNEKLRKLSQLSAAIQSDAITMFSQFRNENSTINSDLNTAIQSLNSSKIINNDIQKLETSRRAIEYTTEKNRYSNLYLGIYAFLNISALAIILHIASS
jgi:hypothetical protein